MYTKYPLRENTQQVHADHMYVHAIESHRKHYFSEDNGFGKARQ